MNIFLPFLLCIFTQTILAQQISSKEATDFTKQENKVYLQKLNFNDKQDFLDASHGFIAELPNGVIKDKNDRIIWDLSVYDFEKDDNPPDTINPSLWRMAKLNLNNGLFKVTDNIYQIRGFDMSNMTIIEGNTGLIIIDPLVSKETAKAGLDLYYQNRPQRQVLAVIYTHSHVDHFGGVKGVVDEQDVKNGKVRIIAPEGFLEAAVSENVYAGNAMSRRSQYQYGTFLPVGPKGQVDTGLGKSVSTGEITLIPPTDSIRETGEKLTIDGIEMEFQMAPHTEAPAEMLIYFPQFKTLNSAEDMTHTLHNLYTLRGAQVRDAAEWWKTINTAIDRYGDKVEVIIAQHHWPKWGNANIVAYMKKQRNLYKYIHDQVLRYLNKGYTPIEIAEMLELPAAIDIPWYNRGYYGSVNHDAKAVYQRYLGWYDSNPANLHPILPVEAAKKYVAYMGGAKKVIKQAKIDYSKGEYRWVAEVLKQVVYADPDNRTAKELLADAFEQLGYSQENPTWRNEYLMAAYELRNGKQKDFIDTASTDVIMAMSPEMILDFMGLSLNGPKASKQSGTFNFMFSDLDKNYAVTLEDGVLIYSPEKKLPDADVTIEWAKPTMVMTLAGKTTLEQEIASGNVKIVGKKQKFIDLLQLLDKFQPTFNIVTPNPLEQ